MNEAGMMINIQKQQKYVKIISSYGANISFKNK